MEFTIGSKVYLIHKGYVRRNRTGARIILARVKTFERTSKGISPIFIEIGKSKFELTIETHMAFDTIEKAIANL